jgi:hypothetical protein
MILSYPKEIGLKPPHARIWIYIDIHLYEMFLLCPMNVGDVIVCYDFRLSTFA